MDSLPEVLLDQIECPICLQYMTPPIKQCLNGHNICKDCRHKIKKCPVCRENLADIRNLTAESMSRLITHPCVNKKFGCTGHFLLDFKEKHEKTCLFRSIVTNIPTAMDSFQEVLLTQIECPICLQYMTPPIKQCLNGHNICKDCRHKIEKCPVCRENLADIRNLTAESMSRLITHPCVNKKFGCTGHFLLDFKEEHEKTCLFRSIVCPCWFCEKEGTCLETQEHFKNDHLKFQKKAKDGKYKITFRRKSVLPKTRFHKHGAVREFGEVFFAVMMENFSNSYIGHFYLGEEEEARKFGYKITLTSQDGNETMSSYRLCRSYLSLNKVLGTGNKKHDEYFSTFPKCFKFGCTGHFLLDFKEKHEKTCLFRSIVCPDWHCQKEDTYLGIKEHFKNDHLVFQEKAKDGKYKKTFRRISSYDPKTGYFKYGAVPEFGEVFFASKMDNFCNLDYVGHFYLGEEEQARKFGYKMTLTSQDGKETMSSYRLCRSYLSLNKKLYTGNNYYEETYSTFPKYFVDKCWDSNNYLTYDFEILQDSTRN
ncbi:hypothetical protein C0J52_25186 [Blattella germanica]|nr:hypothetical protein C0J52_25186 [Blattella germanica]